MLNLPLHHIGVATRNIEVEFAVFEQLGYSKASDVFIDPTQKIKGMFITAQGQPTLELLENIDATGPLDTCLKNGVKFYHFSYEVADIEAALADVLCIKRAKLIVPVTPATYFSNVCFVMLPNMMLIELVTCSGLPSLPVQQ